MLLSDQDSIFSMTKMKTDYLLKNVCLIGYKVITWNFFNYDIFLMYGSPALLDRICTEVIALL